MIYNIYSIVITTFIVQITLQLNTTNTHNHTVNKSITNIICADKLLINIIVIAIQNLSFPCIPATPVSSTCSMFPFFNNIFNVYFQCTHTYTHMHTHTHTYIHTSGTILSINSQHDHQFLLPPVQKDAFFLITHCDGIISHQLLLWE